MGALKLSDINFEGGGDVRVYDILHNLKFWGTGPLLAIVKKANEELINLDGNHQVAYALLDEAEDKITALNEALERLADQWKQNRVKAQRQVPETDTETPEAIPVDTMNELEELRGLLTDGVMILDGIKEAPATAETE